ncbi:MAG: hypothetical protein ABIE36_02950 [Candidatus Diapherotrites archaeon]
MGKSYFDYNNKLIPKDKIGWYYENGMMSISSMNDYESDKEKIIKEGEETSNLIKSIKYIQYKNSSKLLNSLRRLKSIFNFT